MALPANALSLTAAQVEKLSEADALEVLAAHVKAKEKSLAEALSNSKSKALAKAAKKAIYQLKSHGVAIAEAAPVAAKPAVSAPVDDFPALMTNVLGTGERAIFFARPVRGAGLEIFQCVIHDELGILQLDRVDANRAAYRNQLRAVQQRQKVLVTTLARIKSELGAALARNETSKTELPPGADQQLRRLEVTRIDSTITIPAVEATDAALAQKAESLHEEMEVGQWLPPEAQIALLAAAYDEVRAAKPADEAAQIEKKTLETAKAFFTAPMRQLYARRLWTSAEFFDATERPEQAKIARAEARRLFHTSEPTKFGDKLFEKVIAISEAAKNAPPAGGPIPTLRPPLPMPPQK